jgi:hypothetical protein
MIPDIDAGKVTVTVNASSSAANLTAEVEVHSGGKRVSCVSSNSCLLRHICSCMLLLNVGAGSQCTLPTCGSFPSSNQASVTQWKKTFKKCCTAASTNVGTCCRLLMVWGLSVRRLMSASQLRVCGHLQIPSCTMSQSASSPRLSSPLWHPELSAYWLMEVW